MDASQIVVVDYGLGNLASVANALKKLEIPSEVSGDPDAVRGARALIVPGVGAAGRGMQNLQAKGLDSAVRDQAEKGVPVLGICLGMQLLLPFSEEGEAECLGLLPGKVRKFQTKLKIPHIGWNQVSDRGGSLLLKGVPKDSYFYFVNSYYCDPADPAVAKGVTTYGTEFCSLLEKDNIYGVQFHPEKSGDAGLQLLRNFWEAAC